MRWLFLAALLPTGAIADSLVATRTIRATAIVAPEDVTLVAAAIPGALVDPAEALGLEARVTIYAGRALRAADLGPPAIVERNQIVPMAFRAGGLTILAEGRAMARGGVGDSIRVMNLASRTTVTGRIGADGVVAVGGP